MFHSPASIAVSGVSGSGKTTVLFKILEHKDELFTVKPEKIMYCYGVWQSLFEQKEKELDINFHEGLPSEEEIKGLVARSHNRL